MEEQLKEMLDKLKKDNQNLLNGLTPTQREREKMRVDEDIRLSARLDELKADLKKAKSEEEKIEIRQKILVIKSTLFNLRNCFYGLGM